MTPEVSFAVICLSAFRLRLSAFRLRLYVLRLRLYAFRLRLDAFPLSVYSFRTVLVSERGSSSPGVPLSLHLRLLAAQPWHPVDSAHPTFSAYLSLCCLGPPRETYEAVEATPQQKADFRRLTTQDATPAQAVRKGGKSPAPIASDAVYGNQAAIDATKDGQVPSYENQAAIDAIRSAKKGGVASLVSKQ